MMALLQLMPLVIGIPFIGFWLWMLVNLNHNMYLSKETNNKWSLPFVLLNIFGALWHYLVEYRPMNL